MRRRTINDPTFGPFLLDGEVLEIYVHAKTGFTDRIELSPRVELALDEENDSGVAHQHATIRVRANVAAALGGRHSLCSGEEIIRHLAKVRG